MLHNLNSQGLYNFKRMDSEFVDDNSSVSSRETNQDELSCLNLPPDFPLPSLEKLILNQCNIDFENYKCYNGVPPVLMAYRMCKSEKFVKFLIKSGCDLSVPDKDGITLLHEAVSGSFEFLDYVLGDAVNINVQDNDGWTPLHYAIMNRDLWTVCYFLRLKADPNIANNDGITPLMLMFEMWDLNTEHFQHLECCEVCEDYFQGFRSYDVGVIFEAINCSIPSLAIPLIKGGANVNCIKLYENEVNTMLEYSLNHSNDELFKAIWPRFDQRLLLVSEIPFLFTFFQCCVFPNSEWLECLYLLFDTSIAVELVQHYQNSRLWYFKKEEYHLFQELIFVFYKHEIELSDRISVIYTFLSLGAEVTYFDISTVHRIYGFNDEIEALIYGMDTYERIIKGRRLNFPLTDFILAMEENYNVDNLLLPFKNSMRQMLYRDQDLDVDVDELVELKTDSIVNCLGYFSLPFYVKYEIMDMSQKYLRYYRRIHAKICILPEFPSLIELSRNKARQLIKQNYKIEKPYHFHEAVSSLPLPQKIKDIISFKKPIYDYD